MIADLEELFAPIGATAFFDRHYERGALHLTAKGGERRGVLSHAELRQAIASVEGVPEGVVCFPEHVGMTAEGLFSEAGALDAYLAAGHPIVWNRARGISAGVDALSELLGRAFGAHVWPNVYSTGEAGTPFDMHFDAHEVIAIQCEGEKEWTISEVRVDRPLDVAEMEAAVKGALRGRREEAAGRTAMEVTARPGDLVYVPRGQFHNARATRGRSLHVTFGLSLPVGFELGRVVLGEMLADPAMRELLPPVAADESGERTAEQLVELSERLREAMSPERLARAAMGLRAHWARGRGGGRGEGSFC
ncbi:MAG: cupin domain-containing protein [Polyangiaceae bacterium]